MAVARWFPALPCSVETRNLLKNFEKSLFSVCGVFLPWNYKTLSFNKKKIPPAVPTIPLQVLFFQNRSTPTCKLPILVVDDDFQVSSS